MLTQDDVADLWDPRVAEPEAAAIFKAEPESISQPEAELLSPEKTELEMKAATASINEQLSESLLQDEPEKPAVEKPVEETYFKAGPAPDPEPAAAMLADRFSTDSKSLSETMASSRANGVMGSRLLYQPISDLSTGIGLNDKFSFISELFGNNPVLYEEAITRINKAVNIDEAGWILQKYHSTEWEHKHETLARLKDFIKRRFI